jgi:ferredoxin
MEKLVLILIASVLALSMQYGSAFMLGPRRIRHTSALRATHTVTIKHEGAEHVLTVSEDTSILDAAVDAGIDLPHDCKMGICLTCPSRIVSGTCDHDGSTLEESVIGQGYALTCCCFPRSDCVIESIEEDELVNAQFERD